MDVVIAYFDLANAKLKVVVLLIEKNYRKDTIIFAVFTKKKTIE